MNVNIRLEYPILPEGAVVTADVSCKGDLNLLSAAILKVNEEAAASRDATPGERVLKERITKIENSIIAGLPSLAKLSIANEVATRG